LWVGDAAAIRAAAVRKQKTDARDAQLILDLLVRDKFPQIWIPSPEIRDLRQMLRHQHKLVRFRTSVQNQLHGLAMSQGLCRRAKLWTKAGRKELENLPLDPWASRRRTELLKAKNRALASGPGAACSCYFCTCNVSTMEFVTPPEVPVTVVL
jgi:transposase